MTKNKIASTAIIGDNVTIGENTEIMDHVIIHDNVSIGANCKIYPFVVIGSDPQDYSFKPEDNSSVTIGDFNIIREYVSIHTGVGLDSETKIGNHNFIMSYCHIAHNAVVGDHVTLTNSVQVGGHSHIEDYVNIGGLTAIHQNCRVGKHAMISGMSATSKDLPPYMIFGLIPAVGASINRIGLKRHNFSSEVLRELNKAYKIIYKMKLSLPSAIARLEEECEQLEEIKYLINFLKSSKRGIKLDRTY
jgi:UDP-N-acetylglucosamine acyltransferase